MVTRALTLVLAFAPGLAFAPACDSTTADLPDQRVAGLTRSVPSQHATIQAAIDASAAGDVIAIAPGAYGEDLTLKSGVTLAGAGSDKTTVYGRVKATNASSIVLRDLALRGDFDQDAIGLDLVNSSATVTRTVIRGFLIGMRTNAAAAPTKLDAVKIESCGEGIATDTTSKLTVQNSVFTSIRGHGMRIGPGTTGAVLLVNSLLYANGFAQNGAAVRVESAGGFRVANTVIVSNKIGLSCISTCNADHDLVWGNGTNYSGTAVSVASSNYSLDPKLQALAEGDFTPRADSPLLEIGDPTVAPPADFFGQLRPSGTGVDIGPVERPIAASATIVISEVLANPIDEAAGEFIELYNVGTTAVDLAGWVIDDGDAKDTLAAYQGGATTLAPGGFAVVLDPDWNAAVFAVPPAATRLAIAATTTLGSGLATNDPVTLVRPDGTVADTYGHPFDPGNGVSVEKDDPVGGDAERNWVRCPCAATPGAENCAWAPPPPPPVVDVVLTEVMANPLDEATGEYLELLNLAAVPVEVGGWVIDDGDSTDQIEAFQGGGTLIPAGGYAVVFDPDYAGQYVLAPGALRLTIASTVTIGNGLATNDPITLRTPTGAIASTYGHPFDPGNGTAAVRVSPAAADLPQSWIPSACPSHGSPGAADCTDVEPPPPPTIAITEVMSNPIDEDRDEYVELYNYGPHPLDLAGWLLSDGDTQEPIAAFDAGGPTILQPGARALIMDSEFLAGYAIPAGTLRLRTVDSSLGTGLATDDPIALRTPAGELVASFGVPFNPGNGISAERVSLAAGDTAGNWVASPCKASPGARNCGAAEELEHALVRPTVAITEVMSNPLDEATGELVELYNAGSIPIDLAGWKLGDGAATEALVRFSGSGAMVLAPGAFAVVLDRGHTTEYVTPPGTLLLTSPDATIGNGLATTDLVTLYDATGAAISTYAHPFNPGNGISAERTAPTVPSSTDAWKASTCAARSSPGAPNCVGPAPVAGTRTLGQACAWGTAECQSGLCMIDPVAPIGSGALCSAACPPGAPCAAGECVATGDPGAPFACWPADDEPPPPAGTPPARLLITEALVGPTAAEFIEIHNPSANAISLSHVWLADYAGYHGVTTGSLAPINSDFRARFPDGASIAAGGYVTVSLETAAIYQREHGILPSYDTSTTGSGPHLIGQIGALAGLTNGGEAVVLFHWDGVSALVTDLDYVVWGSSSGGFDKTGVAVGSAAYKPDTALASQKAAPAPTFDGLSITRCDLGEASESGANGNGIAGANETSEDFAAAFQIEGHSPGVAGDCDATCTPSCAVANACGDDGCGASCGTCGAGKTCDAGVCVTVTSQLIVTQITDFVLPEGYGAGYELMVFRSSAQFQGYFKVAPPASLGLSPSPTGAANWALFYSAGRQGIPGHKARITEVADSGNGLFVFGTLQVPGDGCTVMGLKLPAWTMVKISAPPSGNSSLTDQIGEEDFSCAASGQPAGNECDDERLCAPGLVCAGITLEPFGYCNPNWMWKMFQAADAVAIPDAATIVRTLEVGGLASVPMDIILYLEIDHPAPEQLVVNLRNAPGEDGTPTGSVTVWNRQPADGGIVLHQAIRGLPGDEHVNGPWSLEIIDAVTGQTGTLKRWTLEITSRWD